MNIELFLDKDEELAGDDEEFDDDVQEAFSCKYCEYQTTKLDDLDEHIITHEEEIFEENGEGEVEEFISVDKKYKDPCSSNPKKEMGQMLPAFYQQFATKTDKKVFVCPFCGYQTMKYFDLNWHLKKHSEPSYACSECPYTTNRKHDINKHLLVHCNGTGLLFKCVNCHYETNRKDHLNRHLLVHKNNVGLVQDNFLFKCTECGYTSKRLCDLHRHAILHCDRTITDAFKCTKCDYASAVENSFARHVLSHCEAKEMPVTIFPKDNSKQDKPPLHGLDKGNISSVKVLDKGAISKSGEKRKAPKKKLDVPGQWSFKTINGWIQRTTNPEDWEA